ncbi:MAG: hypothetical protein QXR65_09530, partial [Candidatus Bathyarchaeia archaeon]
MPSIALLEVKLREPLIITRRIGKGGFYSSSNMIPGSTILGALSREAILYNVENRRGDCVKLNSPNDPPPCEGCSEKGGCPYIALWRENRIKISDALPSLGNRQKLGEVETIPELQSIFRGKKSGTLVDGLLFNTVQRMALKGEVPEDLLVQRLKAGDEEVKRKPRTVAYSYTDNKIRIEEVSYKSYSASHVGIDPSFRTSERALLFSIEAYPEGTIFLCRIIGEPGFIDEHVKNREVRLGASKSRGYGLASINVIGETPLEKYFEMRSEAIEEGFDEIQRRFSSYGVNVFIGTLTGLSPLSLMRKEGMLSPFQAVSERIGVPQSSIITLMYRRGVRPRWDGGLFIFTPSLNPGYAAAFTLQRDPRDEAPRLARAEIELLDDIPGYGWVYVNHP